MSVQFSSVAQSCLTLCDPMNCSMPGLPVHHQLPEFTQTHVHWVGDAIQPSHPLPPIPPSIRVLSNESALRMRWPKYWSFSFSIIPSKSILEFFYLLNTMSFPDGSDGKESACNAGDLGLIPGSGRSPGDGNGNPLQFSCLEKPMDRGVWRAIILGVAKSWTWLSN